MQCVMPVNLERFLRERRAKISEKNADRPPCGTVGALRTIPYLSAIITIIQYYPKQGISTPDQFSHIHQLPHIIRGLEGSWLMASVKGARTGDVGAFLRATKTVIRVDSLPHHQRAMLAQWCRWIGKQLGQNMASKLPVKLSPRLKETLELLLAGNSEKEVAAKMGISTHTVHVHVKTLHKRLGVSSRGELLARFVNNDSQVNSSTPQRNTTRARNPQAKPERRSENGNLAYKRGCDITQHEYR